MPVMDDSTPRRASALSQGERLARRLAALPLSELHAALAELDRPAINSLLPFLPIDCKCPVNYGCPDHPGETCECPVIPEPCPHIVEARRREWLLPDDAITFLLWMRNPGEYLPPGAEPRPSRNTNPRAQVAIMAERHRKRQQLRHPGDWCRRELVLDERLTRRLGRLRNGADAPGPLVLEES